jgi:hypothetical protein
MALTPSTNTKPHTPKQNKHHQREDFFFIFPFSIAIVVTHEPFGIGAITLVIFIQV